MFQKKKLFGIQSNTQKVQYFKNIYTLCVLHRFQISNFTIKRGKEAWCNTSNRQWLGSRLKHTFHMMAEQSLDEDAKYSPLLENCTNQTSFLCSVSICNNKKSMELHIYKIYKTARHSEQQIQDIHIHKIS